MADRLVLEEDGTSRLELEESTDDFLLEESVHDGGETTGFATVGTVASGAVPTAVAGAEATWKVGTITVPSGTGSQTVTGLGGIPKALIFFGTNWLTEDAAVTGNGSGLFRGMCAPKYDDPGTLLQNAACVVAAPAGNAHNNTNGSAIVQLDTSGGNVALYYAQVTSLDADGFSLNWSLGSAGGHKVVYAALMDTAECGAYVGVVNTTLTLGWKPGASLLHGSWAGPHVGGADRTQEFYGGGAYPGGSTAGWSGAGIAAFCFPTSSSQQYLCELDNSGPHIKVCGGGHFTGPFLVTSNIRSFPSGTGLNSLTFDGDSQDGGMVVAWDDEDNQTGRLTPATSTAGTATVSGLPFAPGLVITYTISDEPDGQGTGARGALGMSVVADEFEWCATVDGHSSVGAFQSFQRGFADVVNGSSVHAGTVALTADGFVLTTEEDDVSPANVVWHAFGHPERIAVWIPQEYRRN